MNEERLTRFEPGELKIVKSEKPPRKRVEHGIEYWEVEMSFEVQPRFLNRIVRKDNASA